MAAILVIPLAGIIGSAARAAAAVDVTDMSLEQLMQVTVVGASKYEQKQSEVAAAVRVITRQEIRAHGWRTLDEALASLPGIYTTYDRQYVYFGTRGFGLPGDYNTRVLVMINGNRMNDPTFDQAPFGRVFPLDMDLVERIEFIPGPGGAVYGQNAMFGVVNVITRSGAEVNGTELAVGYQEPQSQTEGRMTWGKVVDGFNVLLSVDGMQARGQNLFFDYGATGISGYARGLDGERDDQLFASAARGPWSFDLEYANHHKDDPTGTAFSDPLVPGQFQADGYTVGQLQYLDRFAADRLEFSARFFSGQERYSSILVYGTPFSYPAIGDWIGTELRLVATQLAHQKLMAGIELQDNTRHDQFIYDLVNPAADVAIRGAGHRDGFYAQDEWQVAATFSATLGLRLDRNDETGSKTSPRVALIWQPLAAATLKALYGQAHRAPNAYERDYADGVSEVGNPGLQGETIDTVEVVGDYRVTPQLGLRASVYSWRMRDLIELGTDPLTGLAQYQNGETDDARGVELSGDRSWEFGGRLRGSVSLQKATRPGDAGLVNSPELLGKLDFSAPLPLASRLGFELQYDSRRLTLAGSDTGGFLIGNLVLATGCLAPRLDVSLGLYNVANRRYAEPAAPTSWQNSLVQDGRSVLLKLRYAF